MALLRGLAIELIRKTSPKNFQAAIENHQRKVAQAGFTMYWKQDWSINATEIPQSAYACDRTPSLKVTM
jgi:hypothetical protein